MKCRKETSDIYDYIQFDGSNYNDIMKFVGSSYKLEVESIHNNSRLLIRGTNKLLELIENNYLIRYRNDISVVVKSEFDICYEVIEDTIPLQSINNFEIETVEVGSHIVIDRNGNETVFVVNSIAPMDMYARSATISDDNFFSNTRMLSRRGIRFATQNEIDKFNKHRQQFCLSTGYGTGSGGCSCPSTNPECICDDEIPLNELYNRMECGYECEDDDHCLNEEIEITEHLFDELQPKEYTEDFLDKWESIKECFDWKKVHKTMVYLDWKWLNDNEFSIPTKKQLKKTAKRLLHNAYTNKYGFSGSGGFEATYEDEVLELKFVLTDWSEC